jgi:hypothetical protein
MFRRGGSRVEQTGQRQQNTPEAANEPPQKTGGRYTATAIGLNVLLLAMIVYGYTESRDLKWAWILVGIPIAVVTLTYIRHWFKS